jgi:hypothetical protein
MNWHVGDFSSAAAQSPSYHSRRSYSCDTIISSGAGPICQYQIAAGGTRLASSDDKAEEGARNWWVFAFYLPTEAAYVRVKIWRRLQNIGAAPFKNALYLLPATPDTLEDLEWTLREVYQAGGEGVIFAGSTVQGLSDGDLAGLFDAAREAQYRELADEVQNYLATFEGRQNHPTAADAAAQLNRYRGRLAAIEAIDFFQANGREHVHALLRALEPRAIEPGTHAEEAAMNTSALATLSGRTWVTRANVQVDRMASAWLIKRCIDPTARFKFVTDRHYRPSADEVRFDMYEAEYTHDAERCTFEVLLDLLERPDSALRRIAEIVHELDLRDHKYQRDETAGIKQLLGGLVASHAQDEDRLERAGQLFDDLYQSFVRAR